MKKTFTKLLIISIICAIISFVLCMFSVKSNSFNFSTTNQVVDEVKEAGSDNPGAGWYLLLAGGTAAMADIAIGFATIFLIILIPGFMLFFIVISQGISRLVQIGEDKKWKNTTSKVFTYISIILQIFLSFVYIFNLLSNLKFNRLLLGLALITNVANIVVAIKELIKIKKFPIENA